MCPGSSWVASGRMIIELRSSCFNGQDFKPFSRTSTRVDLRASWEGAGKELGSSWEASGRMIFSRSSCDRVASMVRISSPFHAQAHVWTSGRAGIGLGSTGGERSVASMLAPRGEMGNAHKTHPPSAPVHSGRCACDHGVLRRWLIAIIAIERVDQMPLRTSRQWVIRGRDSEQ